jgi:hypothetical protein
MSPSPINQRLASIFLPKSSQAGSAKLQLTPALIGGKVSNFGKLKRGKTLSG